MFVNFTMVFFCSRGFVTFDKVESAERAIAEVTNYHAYVLKFN